jgi:C4-dicarboxylate-specific signal transduction histidine kinase
MDKTNRPHSNSFQLVFNQLPNLVCLLDEDLNFHEVNEHFLNLYRTTNEKIIGTHFSEIFDTYSFINFIGLFIKSTELEGSIVQTVLFDRQQKQYKFVLKKISSNEEKLIMIFGEDQTKLFEKNQELIAYKAKTVNISKMAVLGEMSSGVSQEIINPITLILNHSTQIQRALASAEFSKEEITSKLLKIHKNAKRIHRITKSIEIFSLDKNLDPIRSTLVADIINNSLELCHEKLKASEINLIIENVDPNLKLECKVNQMAQIILNLVNNSKDALGETDQKERWIKVSASDAGEFVKFKIQDSGNGIPKEVQEKLFSNFFTTKSDNKGTGLGLSVSKEIIESHYGKFYLDNDELNTCFVFEIPKGLSSVI